MALPNRVDAFGTLFATPERGAFLGNRGGQFHNSASKMVNGRPYASRQWICCRLSFKDRHRTVWGKGYTELFFSDEYAALAAGHRPCFECRREDAVAFAAAWGRVTGTPPPRAPVMDMVLHNERLEGQDRGLQDKGLQDKGLHSKRLHVLPSATLPDGTMIAKNGQAWLIKGDSIHLWTFGGYTIREPFPRSGTVAVLTPPSIIGCLRMGYQPASG
jgi:hypothetical protein